MVLGAVWLQRSYFVPLLQHLAGVCVKRDKLIGVLDPDRSSRLFCLHPLWREGVREQLRTDDHTKTTEIYGEIINRAEFLLIFRGKNVVHNSSSRWRCSSNFSVKSNRHTLIKSYDVVFALMGNYSERWDLNAPPLCERGRDLLFPPLTVVVRLL